MKARTRSVTLVESSPGSDTWESCGNVFADLGLPDAAILSLKVQLAVEICRVLDSRNLSTEEASALGLSQVRITKIKQYKLKKYSVVNLIRTAEALGFDTLIQLRPHAGDTNAQTNFGATRSA